jgi:hypothetical protein
MQQSVLKNTLGLSTPDEMPTRRPACIIGYSLAKKDKQKVLLLAQPPQGEVVKGLAVQVDSEEMVERLLEHTRNLSGEVEVVGCDVHFLDEMDPANVKGWVVVFSGESEGLGKPSFLDRMRWAEGVEELFG